MGNAINELRRFTNNEPLKNSIVAPMALSSSRPISAAQNNAQEAAAILAKAPRNLRARSLTNDPERAKLGRPVALSTTASHCARPVKLPEAQAIFQQVVKQFARSAEGIEAALRFGQCLQRRGRTEASTRAASFGRWPRSPRSWPSTEVFRRGL